MSYVKEESSKGISIFPKTFINFQSEIAHLEMNHQSYIQ